MEKVNKQMKLLFLGCLLTKKKQQHIMLWERCYLSRYWINREIFAITVRCPNKAINDWMGNGLWVAQRLPKTEQETKASKSNEPFLHIVTQVKMAYFECCHT